MKLKVTVNPNPFTSQLVVFIQGNFTMNAVVRLMNKTGTIIRVASVTVNKGGNEIKIDNLGRYATGNYLLEVKLLNGDLLETITLIKK